MNYLKLQPYWHTLKLCPTPTPPKLRRFCSFSLFTPRVSHHLLSQNRPFSQDRSLVLVPSIFYLAVSFQLISLHLFENQSLLVFLFFLFPIQVLLIMNMYRVSQNHSCLSFFSKRSTSKLVQIDDNLCFLKNLQPKQSPSSGLTRQRLTVPRNPFYSSFSS